MASSNHDYTGYIKPIPLPSTQTVTGITSDLRKTGDNNQSYGKLSSTLLISPFKSVLGI